MNIKIKTTRRGFFQRLAALGVLANVWTLTRPSAMELGDGYVLINGWVLPKQLFKKV